MKAQGAQLPWLGRRIRTPTAGTKNRSSTVELRPNVWCCPKATRLVYLICEGIANAIEQAYGECLRITCGEGSVVARHARELNADARGLLLRGDIGGADALGQVVALGEAIVARGAASAGSSSLAISSTRSTSVGTSESQSIMPLLSVVAVAMFHMRDATLRAMGSSPMTAIWKRSSTLAARAKPMRDSASVTEGLPSHTWCRRLM